MKFFHLADLHLGRKLLGESLIEEQSYILEEIMKNVRVEKPDGIFICGDLYDKYITSSESVALFDSFLEALVKENCEVFIISGNHDGASRLEFASGLLKKQKVHICGTYKGKIESVEQKDENGKLIWECPNCGNTDQNKMAVARRTCGYIGTQFWNQGSPQELKARVLHL